MVGFGRMLVVAGFAVSGVAARRHEISLHQDVASADTQSAYDGPCARSCSVISSEIFWKVAQDPVALMAEVDKNCASPECKGCRRAAGGLHRSTKPDCAAAQAAEIVQQVAETPQVTQVEEGIEPSPEIEEGASELTPESVSEGTEQALEQEAAKEVTEKVAAMEACAMVGAYAGKSGNDGDVDCRSAFQTHPERMYKKYEEVGIVVPRSYKCLKQYLCKSKNLNNDETVGPVATVADCGNKRLQAEKTCVAVKL